MNAGAVQLRAPVSLSGSQFFGRRAYTQASRQVVPASSRVARQQVQVNAFFGFGKSSSSSSAAGTTPAYHICIDCGWIYDGDFKKAPGSFRCPACNSPKSRFKVFKGKVQGKVNNTGAAMKKRFSAKEW